MTTTPSAGAAAAQCIVPGIPTDIARPTTIRTMPRITSAQPPATGPTRCAHTTSNRLLIMRRYPGRPPGALVHAIGLVLVAHTGGEDGGLERPELTAQSPPRVPRT